jgi:hypothetical protein
MTSQAVEVGGIAVKSVWGEIGGVSYKACFLGGER